MDTVAMVTVDTDKEWDTDWVMISGGTAAATTGTGSGSRDTLGMEGDLTGTGSRDDDTTDR